MGASAAVITRLREMIRSKEMELRDDVEQEVLRFGLSDLDDLLPHGISPGSVGEVAGHWSSGKTSVALAAAAEATKKGIWVALVDGQGGLYPPALAALGLQLERVLMVQVQRPSPDRQRGQAGWAAEQVARSGHFGLVILLAPGGLDRALVRRLQLAAEAARAVVIVVHDTTSPPGSIRLRLHVAPGAGDGFQPRHKEPGKPWVPLVAPLRRCGVRVERKGRSDAARIQLQSSS
jgi:recombination protein RecA